MAIWLGLIGGSFYWAVYDTREEEKLMARNTARAIFQQVLVSRQWNVAQGGVYVPVTPRTRPNSLLQVPNRDLTADNGLKLTWIDHGYMIRQMSALAKSNAQGFQLHLTSLAPLDEKNRPFAWERPWLEAFKQGSQEQGDFFVEGGIRQYRYMAPLRVESACLKCHGQQGYKLGDVRGGLSVSLPYPTYFHKHLTSSYGAVMGIGLCLIFFGGGLYERRRRLFEATFNSPIPCCVTDKNFRILMANRSYWAVFGPRPDQPKILKCHAHRPGDFCHSENCTLLRILANSGQFTFESVKRIGGLARHFIITAKPLLDGRGRTIGIVESFQDITERKGGEEALEQLNLKLETLSITDGLTGIANRRHFDEVLAQEYARHSRSDEQLSLILLDIDFFKSFNDFYGHVKGDDCLQQVARVVADCAVRPFDLAARYGGEEFACILPATGSAGAVAIGEKIRQGIIALAIPHRRSKVAAWVTASLGIVTLRCTGGGTGRELVARADRLLYQAKAAGRNRVEADSPWEIPVENKDKIVQLRWQNSFCCGHPVIDAQHQSLVQLCNELLGVMLRARFTSEVAVLIQRLLEEIKDHFKAEEEILGSTKFPGLKEHAEEHKRLLARGIELAEEFKLSGLRVGDLFQYLVNEVVMHHLLEADQKYVSYLGQARVPESKGQMEINWD
jgi:diguanylate cyclase (GGDEF)-like protein/hemerythrin-like metal-binding protein/PAS domain S-box-containing protein